MIDIPKKYNIKEREEYWQKFWKKEKLFKFRENLKKPIFSVDTPPPYVSAEHLHAGHIMSYSQAEFIVRYKRMRGFNVFYPMGFDDNGLPTERFVEKKYKVNKKTISRADFVRLCLKETKIGAENYKKLWNSLGISVDWSKTYSTINDLCQKRSQWSFIELYKKGKIYRAKKPILWCTTCQTAISQADLEPEERDAQLIYIKFKIKDSKNIPVFATTRPELLPACMGISINPNDERSKHLIGKTAVLPLTNKEVEITADEEGVDPKFGTGIVYFCSYGGGECVEWLSRHTDAEPVDILNPDGRFNEFAGKYKGLTIKEARKKIIKDLKNVGAIEKIEPIKNVTHVHERCGTDVEYITTEQWFIKILEDKDKFLEFGRKLNWNPGNMQKKYIDWVESLKWDWCISRQRYYGVPFPVWYCKKCNEPAFPDIKDLPVDPTINKTQNKCLKCQNNEFIAESDVMDTWMTSSMTPYIINDLVKNNIFPNSLRPQAFEIIRTWLFYSVVKAYFHDKSIPFEDVMISGHGLDQHGRKISKRLGNYVDPAKIISQYGADALRYWATGAKLGENLRYNEEEIKKGKRTVTKIWNASKFCISHFQEFKEVKLEQKVESADKWVLGELFQTIEKATDYFEKYNYSKARDIIDKFFWHIFTDNYMEFIKYRLYSEEKELVESKKIAKNVLYRCILSIIKLYAPILPFITEEIYQLYFKNHEAKKSIHTDGWPKAENIWQTDNKFRDEFEKVLNIINEIRKYKSDNGISLGKEIEEYQIKNVNQIKEEYIEFIKNVMRVKNITSEN